MCARIQRTNNLSSFLAGNADNNVALLGCNQSLVEWEEKSAQIRIVLIICLLAIKCARMGSNYDALWCIIIETPYFITKDVAIIKPTKKNAYNPTDSFQGQPGTYNQMIAQKHQQPTTTTVIFICNHCAFCFAQSIFVRIISAANGFTPGYTRWQDGIFQTLTLISMSSRKLTEKEQFFWYIFTFLDIAFI